MIQDFAKNDVKRISHLQPDGWEEIVPFFQFYTQASYCRAIKIEDGKHIVALGSMVMFAQTAWFAHIIVDPHMQRRGLGTVITQELIALAERSGRNKQLLIATAKGRPLYENFGFCRSCDYMYYHAHTRREPLINPNIRKIKQTDTPDIQTLDRHATGEDRRALISAGSIHGWVYAGSGNQGIRGYFLPDLGEGTIVAMDAEAGAALTRLRLEKLETAVVLPAGNKTANQLLDDLGIDLKRTATRMVRNGKDPLNQHMLFNRIGGHIG